MTDESLMLLVYFGVTAFILFRVLFELLCSKLKYIKKIKNSHINSRNCCIIIIQYKNTLKCV